MRWGTCFYVSTIPSNLISVTGTPKFIFLNNVSADLKTPKSWWLRFIVRVCSWGLDLQFYSTGTVNKEMCP